MSNPVCSFHYFKKRAPMQYTKLQVLILSLYYSCFSVVGVASVLGCSAGYVSLVVSRYEMFFCEYNSNCLRLFK